MTVRPGLRVSLRSPPARVPRCVNSPAANPWRGGTWDEMLRRGDQMSVIRDPESSEARRLRVASELQPWTVWVRRRSPSGVGPRPKLTAQEMPPRGRVARIGIGRARLQLAAPSRQEARRVRRAWPRDRVWLGRVRGEGPSGGSPGAGGDARPLVPSARPGCWVQLGPP